MTNMLHYDIMVIEVYAVKEEQYLEVRHKTIRKANELIQKSRFSLTLQQQKILLYLISQITPYDETFKQYEFSIPEFCRICGIQVESGKNYKDLKTAIKDIRDKSIWVTMPNGMDSLLSWIEKARIDSGSGIVQIKLDDDMKPFLLQLKENFTQYELIFTLHFKSKYTIRLYELIKSIHFQELQEYKKRYDVDELRRLLDADIYKEYRNLKQRVLTPSTKEINEYSDKIVTMEEIRQGRKVLAVEFTISSKETLDVVKIRDTIDKEMGADQVTLWDMLEQKRLVTAEST